MIRNYFKIAWRSLQKNSLQTGINLLGLTVGTVSCLCILIYIFDQTGYDSHHDDVQSIYRVRNTNQRAGDADWISAASPPPIAFTMKSDYPEVIEACRVLNRDAFQQDLLRVIDTDKGYYEPRGYLADSTFFTMFNYRFIEGNAAASLNAPNTIVLSSFLAKKLFGNQRALDKVLILGMGESALNLTVTGVFDEKFGKSHLNPNYIYSMSTPGMGQHLQNYDNYATNSIVYSYVKLAAGADAVALENKLPQFIEKYAGKDMENAGMTGKILNLQKVTDIHLYSKGIKFQIDKVSNIEYVYFLLLLAFFIQFVACINFINLSTARANKRAKEIGVRKVIGASKISLVGQFFGESFLLSFLAILLSIPITLLLIPFINNITGSNLEYLSIFDWRIIVLLVLLGIFTGLISGFYPAMVITAIKPIRVLKSTVNIQLGSVNFRKALVVFQFVISIGLIVMVVIITQQFSYTQNKDLGFEKNNLIAVRLDGQETAHKYKVLKAQFLELPGVSAVSASRFAPSERVVHDRGVYLPGGNPEDNTIVFGNGIQEGYFETMDIALLQGRDFNSTDENQIIVNKATLKKMGINEEDALTAKLLQNYEGTVYEYPIIGVIEDYHFATLKNDIEPLMLYKSEYTNWLFIRSNSTDYGQLVTDLEKSWKLHLDGVPFSYKFVDKAVEQLYAEEKQLGEISLVFTCLAIVISCLGLFGLISFMAEQKKKEIGIRKVLGASISTIVQLLTKDFIILIGIALAIAAPLSYYLMENWLQDYSYRIEIKWWVFGLAGGFALIITSLTVGFQAIKAAIANPVNSLKTE